MRLMLAPDDLTVGALVTVHSSCVRRRVVPPELAHLLAVDPTCGMDDTPRGVPLRVLGVSLPFVACAILKPGGGECGPTILDVRRVRLARLDPSYVEAISSFTPTPHEDIDDDDVDNADSAPGDDPDDSDAAFDGWLEDETCGPPGE